MILSQQIIFVAEFFRFMFGVFIVFFGASKMANNLQVLPGACNLMSTALFFYAIISSVSIISLLFIFFFLS